MVPEGDWPAVGNGLSALVFRENCWGIILPFSVLRLFTICVFALSVCITVLFKRVRCRCVLACLLPLCFRCGLEHYLKAVQDAPRRRLDKNTSLSFSWSTKTMDDQDKEDFCVFPTSRTFVTLVHPALGTIADARSLAVTSARLALAAKAYLK